MIKKCILMGCFVLVFLMTACNKYLDVPSYYSDFTATGGADTYALSGKAHVTDVLPFLYITSSENTEIDIQGELKGVSGNVEIVYLGADSETILVSTDDNNADIDINIPLENGDGRIEFRGDNIKFNFDLSVNDIDRENVEYLSTESRNPEERTDVVLQETAVVYTNIDKNCVVLNTELDEAATLNISVGVSVSNMDEDKSISFNGFKLAYKTEADEEIEVIKCDEKNFAIGGYEWQDNFSREVELPKGTNKLIFQNTKGRNCKIALDIGVLERK